MADNIIIGPSSGKSQIAAFHDFLLTEIGNIPLATQWVLQIDTLPAILGTELSTGGTGPEPGGWFVAGRQKEINKAITSGLFMDKGLCIFAQGVAIPPEAINVQHISPSDGFQGGLIGAPVSIGRQEFQSLNIAFLETNFSFLDFVVRPWTIYTSHYGLMARSPKDPKNIKTTIQIFFYDRGFNGAPKIRKVFKFYNAAPIQCEGHVSNWDTSEIRKIYTSWTFTHYDVVSNIEEALSDIRKQGASDKFVRETQANAKKLSEPLKINTGPIPQESVGSAAYSNPVKFNLPDAPKLGGGVVTGGSH